MTNLAATCSPDVIVIGGGNAGLCSAITARQLGADVLLLEAAAKPYRGGNSRHTRNFRCMHSTPIGELEDSYDKIEYLNDLISVTNQKTDLELARLTIQSTEECYSWMQQQGVRFQPSLSGTLSLSRTNAFFLGGGKALLNAYYRTAEKLGVKFKYGVEVQHLQFADNKVCHVEAKVDNKTVIYSPKAIVAASGGYQANLDWLRKNWGPSADNFIIRGTSYNTGIILKDLLDQGIESVGDPKQCHAVAIDGRAPKFDGGIVTRLDCVPFSIVVNKNGNRFYDEGEDVWPKRYAIWGRIIADQPDQVGYAIIDSKSKDLFMPSVFPPIKADSIVNLESQLELPVGSLQKTICEFNSACSEGNFCPTTLDKLKTVGMNPPKSNWARPISTAPFYAYELRPGITFTYLGLKVDKNAQVQSKLGPVENLFAAGEIMAGSILGEGYLAGFGMAIGTVFGRLAGKGVATYVTRCNH